jgi:hypothetical protein
MRLGSPSASRICPPGTGRAGPAGRCNETRLPRLERLAGQRLRRTNGLTQPAAGLGSGQRRAVAGGTVAAVEQPIWEGSWVAWHGNG